VGSKREEEERSILGALSSRVLSLVAEGHRAAWHVRLARFGDSDPKDPLFMHPVSCHRFNRTRRSTDRHICCLQGILNLFTLTHPVYPPLHTLFPERCSWIQLSALNHLKVFVFPPRASFGHF